MRSSELPAPSTSAGGSATYCTCPDGFRAQIRALPGEWTCGKCIYNAEKTGSVVPPPSGNNDVSECVANFIMDSTGLSCDACPTQSTSSVRSSTCTCDDNYYAKLVSWLDGTLSCEACLGGKLKTGSMVPGTGYGETDADCTSSSFSPTPPPPRASTANTHTTGGSVTTNGDYTIHTFTFDGIFQVTDAALTTVDVLVVGGGGAGHWSGAGGGGGEVVYVNSKGVTVQAYTVTVGDGGQENANWSSSAFDNVVAFGGSASTHAGADGGQSGGYGTNVNPGGPPGTCVACECSGASGGGIGAPGGDGEFYANDGGDGIQSDISGTATYYGGGGGGMGITGLTGDGGLGRGGDGRVSGSANTGGGGGGDCTSEAAQLGSGGSGIVIVRYVPPASSPSAANTTNTMDVSSPAANTTNTTNTTNASPPAANTTTPPPPPPPMSLEELVSAAEEKTEQAEASRYSLLADISDEKTKAKAKLLADAAIAGVKVKKVSMALTAESDDEACTHGFRRCNSTRA